MLGTTDAIATIGVKDLEKAKTFYSETLGLARPDGHDEPGVCTFKSGGSKIFVYESKFGGTNQATAVTWVVDDVDDEVAALRAKDAVFEHYQLPDTTLEGDVHVSGNMRMAWLKDPDGNVLGLVSEAS